MAEEAWSELKLAFSGFNPRNSYMLALLTLGYTGSELSHYLIGPLAQPIARDIGFGDYACYEKEGFESSYTDICNQYKSNTS